MTGLGQIVERQAPGDVDKRAGNRGDRDVVVDADLADGQGANAPNENSAYMPMAGRGDLGFGRWSFDCPEHEGRGHSAQDGPLATGEDGGHVMRLGAGSAVPDPVDGPELRMQQPTLDPPLHSRACDPGVQELPERDDAVLPRGDPCYLMRYRSLFESHTDTKR